MAKSKFTYVLAIVLVYGLNIAQLCWSLSTFVDPKTPLSELLKEHPGEPLSNLLKQQHNQPRHVKPHKPTHKRHKPHKPHKSHKSHNTPVNNKPLNPPAKNPVENKPVEKPANKPLDHLLEDTLQYLVPHNIARARLGLPPLVWNQTVADYARTYAQERSVDCKLQHSNAPDFGENIAMGSGDVSPAKAVELWAGEQSSYDYGSNVCKQMCGHYTQVVWKDTKSIGCARTKCQNGGTFITCNYYPPGNVMGEKPY